MFFLVFDVAKCIRAVNAPSNTQCIYTYPSRSFATLFHSVDAVEGFRATAVLASPPGTLVLSIRLVLLSSTARPPPQKKHLNLDVVLESTRHLRDITKHLTIYVCRRPTFVVLLRDITRHSGALTPVRPTRHLRDTRSSFLFSPRGLYFQLWPPRATHRRPRLST